MDDSLSLLLRRESKDRLTIWVTETALGTALNVSYMATQLSLFSLVVGIALLLAGVGFIVLALGGTVTRDAGTT